jgi:hypothetical protein
MPQLQHQRIPRCGPLLTGALTLAALAVQIETHPRIHRSRVVHSASTRQHRKHSIVSLRTL